MLTSTSGVVAPASVSTPDFFKNLLLAEQNERWHSAQEHWQNGQQIVAETCGGNDGGDLPAVMERKMLFFTLAHQRSMMLPAIQSALARIETKEFGICTECGGNISHERLQVVPHALVCEHCINNNGHI